MRDHGALRVDAAGALARVHALVVDAGEGHRAVGVDGALGAARRAEEVGQARADGLVVRTRAALGVGPARVRLARGRARGRRWGRNGAVTPEGRGAVWGTGNRRGMAEDAGEINQG